MRRSSSPRSGPSYDRWATVLSFGQDPRWRRFLVSRIDAGPGDTRARRRHGNRRRRARALRQKGCTVWGVDQSPEMLEVAQPPPPGRPESTSSRRAPTSCRSRTAEFDALTFTYLLRYVDDPAATLRELARVVRPGGTIAGLEFGVPRGVWRPLVGALGAGRPTRRRARVIGHGWREAGSFLGGSIRDYDERWPLDRLVDAWRDAGIDDVRGRRLSLGGGNVTWGRKRA